MTAVRKIEITNDQGHPKFRFDSTGLPERPVIMHQCASCLMDSVITNKDAGDLAAWLIGEAVDDAHGRGVIDDPTYSNPTRTHHLTPEEGAKLARQELKGTDLERPAGS